LEDRIVEQHIGLVIIDSIAALMRRDFNVNWSARIEGHAVLGHEAHLLKLLAELYQIPIVISNQVASSYATPSEHALISESGVAPTRDVEFRLTAALGQAWAHNVNTRLILDYCTPQIVAHLQAHSPTTATTTFDTEHRELRRVTIAKSPQAPVCSFAYEIDSKCHTHRYILSCILCVSSIDGWHRECRPTTRVESSLASSARQLLGPNH
jgi:hypothetical protein